MCTRRRPRMEMRPAWPRGTLGTYSPTEPASCSPPSSTTPMTLSNGSLTCSLVLMESTGNRAKSIEIPAMPPAIPDTKCFLMFQILTEGISDVEVVRTDQRIICCA
jgi:hypothetical protein